MKQIFHDTELNDKPVKFITTNGEFGGDYQILIIFEDDSFYVNRIVVTSDWDGYPQLKIEKLKIPNDLYLLGFDLNDNIIARTLIEFNILSLEEFESICKAEDEKMLAQQEARDLNQLNNLLKKYPNYATRNKN